LLSELEDTGPEPVPAATDGTVGKYDLVVVANRLPVDRCREPDGSMTWKTSPGGLVAALEPVMHQFDGAWIGWTGTPGETLEPFDSDGIHLVPVTLGAEDVERYYEGMSNGTLWPLYHDVIAAPNFHRAWWESYVRVNRRFADVALTQAASGARVWIQDYQLQLVPRMIRRVRSDLRIGFFNHIPFPPYEIFSQLPWRRQVIKGLLGADLLGFQRPADANNFLRACRRSGLSAQGGTIRVGGPVRGSRTSTTPTGRGVRASAFPVSIDAAVFDEIAKRPSTLERARQIRAELGDPELVLLGVDRLDYTKGILHRLQAFGELLEEGKLAAPGAVLVQVATPSRERVEQYQQMREQVEVSVGRINGTHGQLGSPAVHYLHQSQPREELVALYLAADVMLVTSLRDGMNLVAKEYLASRYDERGALVLSEFTGAANELRQAFLVNPHDIDGLKAAIVAASTIGPRESTRRMRALRQRVFDFDVVRWASDFLSTLDLVCAATDREVQATPDAELDSDPEQAPDRAVDLDPDEPPVPAVRREPGPTGRDAVDLTDL
jgi:alpha,alpha-trehalose-phosphate synthase [UDP-forming]